MYVFFQVHTCIFIFIVTVYLRVSNDKLMYVMLIEKPKESKNSMKVKQTQIYLETQSTEKNVLLVLLGN